MPSRNEYSRKHLVESCENALLDGVERPIQRPQASDVQQASYSHATSLKCLAVKSRMFLFAASPLVNGNPDYKDFKNSKGELLFNPTYDANKWKKTAAESNKLIDSH